MKRHLLSGAAVLGVSGAVCAAALAATPYSVKLKVPKYPTVGHSFKVGASGVSPASSRLTVFLSTKSCATSAKAEATRSTHEIINQTVKNSYANSKKTKAGSTGSYHACAYLTTGSSTRAHSAVSYFVVGPGY